MVMGSCLCLIFLCSFRLIIFILIRYVATIAMEAFYDEAQLKIAFKHCYENARRQNGGSVSSKRLKNEWVYPFSIFVSKTLTLNVSQWNFLPNTSMTLYI